MHKNREIFEPRSIIAEKKIKKFARRIEDNLREGGFYQKEGGVVFNLIKEKI